MFALAYQQVTQNVRPHQTPKEQTRKSNKNYKKIHKNQQDVNKLRIKLPFSARLLLI